MTDTIRILLVDDHMVVRKGIVLILDDVADMSVVGEADSGEMAIERFCELRPEIVLMDIKMTGMGGIETTRAIRNIDPSARVIGLSTFADPDVASALLDAGGRAYLLKDISASDLTNAIRRVYGGEVILPEELMRPQNASGSDGNEEPVFGDQQKRVLNLMTKGFTNPEIAEMLGLSHPTARYHVSAILRKLDVSNRSEAVAIAIRLGLTNAEDIPAFQARQRASDAE